jgi:hypothetical protein
VKTSNLTYSARLLGFSAQNRTGFLLNASQKCYSYTSSLDHGWQSLYCVSDSRPMLDDRRVFSIQYFRFQRLKCNYWNTEAYEKAVLLSELCTHNA